MNAGNNDITPARAFPDLALSKVTISQGRHLPCWETPHAIYHITLHLADSVPQEQLKIWRSERDRLKMIAQQANRELTGDEIEEMKSVFNERVERYLSSGHGACVLKDLEAANCLAKTLEHDNGSLYSLHEWCIMPNHVHVIVGELAQTSPINMLYATWKRVSAHAINKLIGRHEGSVWHRDAYTRIIRDEKEYAGQMKYVWYNPETAGIADGFLRRRYVP